MAAPVSEKWTSTSILENGNPALTNKDLVPTPISQRTWTGWNFATLWMGMVHNLFGFSILGGMMATGMSALQALLVVTIANLIQLGLIGMNGRVGSRYGIPFAVWARSAFGTFGANVPALLRGAVAIGWFGVQSYLGATAINLLLSTSIGTWKSLGHTVLFGVGANLWIAMIAYWLLNFVLIFHGMETIRRFESWAGPLVLIVMVALVWWAVSRAHGLGPVFHSGSKYNTSWDFVRSGLVPGVALFISGSWATMVLNIPDLTRFARSNRDQVIGTFVGLPVATALYYSMAAIIVSGTEATYGHAYWNPADILAAINNPVLSIVGAVLLAIANLSVNLPANIVSPAYDFTNFLPRYFTFKRAATLAIVLGFAYMPWKLMQNPATIFGVLNNVGAVIGPTTGILIADYWIVRSRRLDVPALYQAAGRYRALNGFNLVGLGTLLIGTGFVILGELYSPLSWAYTYAWFVGIFVGFVGYLLVVGALRAINTRPMPEFEPVGSFGREAAESSAG